MSTGGVPVKLLFHLPKGRHLNEEAPSTWTLTAKGEQKRATRCIKGPHVVTELKEESVRTRLFSCLYLSFEKQYRGNKGKF